MSCVTLIVELNGVVVCDFRFFITEHGMFIMGVNLFDAFNVSVLLGGDRLISSSSSATMPRKSVKPVRQTFCHPPLAKREPIGNELRRLEQEGVIERVDASPWTSNIMTVKKREGIRRLCVNLSDVNKDIIPGTYLLPAMDELTERIAGCTVFSNVDLRWDYLQL